MAYFIGSDEDAVKTAKTLLFIVGRKTPKEAGWAHMGKCDCKPQASVCNEWFFWS